MNQILVEDEDGLEEIPVKMTEKEGEIIEDENPVMLNNVGMPAFKERPGGAFTGRMIPNGSERQLTEQLNKQDELIKLSEQSKHSDPKLTE